MKKKISIVAATHKQQHFLDDWFHSLADNYNTLDKDRYDLEIHLVIDEINEDESIKTQRLINLIREKYDPDYKINFNDYLHGKNFGGPASMTQALSFATGDFIGILEPDDTYKPTKLQETLDYMELEYLDGCHTEIDALVYNREGRANPYYVHDGWKNISVHQEKIVSFERLKQSNCIYTCSWIMKSEWFKSCPTPLTIYNSLGILGDYAMALWMVKNGAKIGYLNRALSIYRDGVGINTTKRQESIESDAKVRDWANRGCPELC